MSAATVLRALLAITLIGPPAATQDGLYSTQATPVWAIARTRHGLVSPDGQSVIHAKEIESSSDSSWPLRVWVTHLSRQYQVPVSGFVSAEVSWAPDSTAFFVTYSDSGAVGQYHLLVYRLSASGIQYVEPIPNGRKLFKPNCMTPGPPNVGGIQWGSDSSTILIAVEVPPTSDCASAGTFRAFEITLPEGKLLKTYDQLEAKRLFKDSLGKELKNSGDDCIRKPNSCVPEGLRLPPPKRNRL